MIYTTHNNIVLTAGDSFVGGTHIQFTALLETVLSDVDGNAFGTYEAGTSYEGQFPKGVFVVTSGSIKLWNK